jgi:hypothetical protein
MQALGEYFANDLPGVYATGGRFASIARQNRPKRALNVC